MSTLKKSKTPHTPRTEEHERPKKRATVFGDDVDSEEDSSVREHLSGKTPFIVTKTKGKVLLSFDEVESEGCTCISAPFLDEETKNAMLDLEPSVKSTGIITDHKGERWFAIFTDIVRVYDETSTAPAKRVRVALKLYNLDSIANWREKNPQNPKFASSKTPVFEKN